MFESCNNLAELNAARIQAASNGGDITEINNQYNLRRKEILNAKSNYRKLTAIKVSPRDVNLYAPIPIIGHSDKPGAIFLTSKGFLI